MGTGGAGELHRVLRDLAVAVARVEEKLDAVRSDRAEDREYLMTVSGRVRKLERGKIWTAGWTAGAGAVVALLVAPIIAFVKELFFDS